MVIIGAQNTKFQDFCRILTSEIGLFLFIFVVNLRVLVVLPKVIIVVKFIAFQNLVECDHSD